MDAVSGNLTLENEQHGMDNALVTEIMAAISQNDGSEAALSRIAQNGHTFLESLADSDTSKHAYLEPIARALYHQYEVTREWSTLEKATDLLQRAIEDTEDDNDIEAASLGDAYSCCLRSRFMRGRNENDLDQAIDFGADSVERTKQMTLEDKVPLLIKRQNNLSICYFTKVHQLDYSPRELIEDAIDLAQSSLELVEAAEGTPELWLETVSNLGMYLQFKYEQFGREEDLETSIDLGYQVKARIPADPDAQVECFSNLAFRLQRGYNHFLRYGCSPQSFRLNKGEQLRDEAIELMTQSLRIPSRTPMSKLDNAMTFLLYIKNLPLDRQGFMLSQSFPFLKDQVDLLEKIAIMSMEEDREDLLSTFYGFSRYAAAAAIEAGVDPYEAIRLLETGRGLASSIQFGNNVNDDLYIAKASLQEKYVHAKANLNKAVNERYPYHERYRLLEDLNAARKLIRAQSGLEDFGSFLGRDAIMALPEEGPIIVINVTDIKSHAIIIQKENIRTILLPNANEDVLSDKSWEIQQLLAKEERGQEVFFSLYAKLSAFLKDLWNWIAKPVLDSLQYGPVQSDKETWPRVCWILTGVLNLYPIHAAGVGLHSKKNNVMNRVISSYSPNLKSLARARSHYSRTKEIQDSSITYSTGSKPTWAIKIIAMPNTPDRVSLEYAREEADTIRALFPTAEIISSPDKETVLNIVTESSAIVHFSCHGEVDYDFPSKSKILLKDWRENPLTVLDIHNLHLFNRRSPPTAFLSACFTANAGRENLQDEADHLASALQIAGFVNVVGTLWDVQQKPAHELVKEFYNILAKQDGNLDAEKVATALHFAILNFRESTREAGNDMKGNPMIWAPFVNVGI